MKKEDLKYGNVIELNDGKRFLYTFHYDLGEYRGSFVRLDYVSSISKEARFLDELKADMIFIHYEKGHEKIVKIYEDYTCKEVLWERKEIVVPEINELEKKILGALPFKYDQWYIARDKNGNLFIYKSKPIKCLMGYKTDTIDGCEPFTIYNSYFNYIKFGDEHIFRICDLYRGKVLGSCNE